jgi:hypothetical protein
MYATDEQTAAALDTIRGIRRHSDTMHPARVGLGAIIRRTADGQVTAEDLRTLRAMLREVLGVSTMQPAPMAPLTEPEALRLFAETHPRDTVESIERIAGGWRGVARHYQFGAMVFLAMDSGVVYFY